MPGWVARADPRTKAGAAPRRQVSGEEKEKGAVQDDFLGSCLLPAVPGTPPPPPSQETAKHCQGPGLKNTHFFLVWASRLCRFREQHYDLIGSTNLFLTVQYGPLPGRETRWCSCCACVFPVAQRPGCDSVLCLIGSWKYM